MIEDNPLGQALLLFMEQRDKWEGSQGFIKRLEKLQRQKDIIKIQKWPGNPTWVTRRINEIESLLEAEGIKYKLLMMEKRILSFRKSTKIVLIVYLVLVKKKIPDMTGIMVLTLN